MKNNKKILILAFVNILLVCQKRKEPTDVDFYVDIDKSATQGWQLTFSGGHIIIEEFDFDADREKGDDVLFTQEYISGLTIPFDISSMVADLEFVIPQGVYKRIDVGFRTFDDPDDLIKSILVEGAYEYAGGGSVPIRFEFSDSEQFVIRAESETGEDIILDKDVQSPAKIILNPPHWFETVPASLFETADLFDVGGTNTILITKTENDDIYDIVLDRLDESALVVFNY